MSVIAPPTTRPVEFGHERSAFMRLLCACQVADAPPGMVQIRLPELREELLNQLPAAHGGVLMSLLDSVMSRAASALPQAPSQTAVTVEMSSRFHRPGRGGLLAEGWVVQASRSLCSCAARITDAQGTLVATAQGTFKYWKAPTTLEK
ncbi:PaaI family thioesterase [Comamonas testosteroni]|uniref:Thioesterase superfamily protein n=1 Tax=Comamonas testosteroni (strain DSM 14576 / KF-1) TaxID=399795 RepID=B7X034_COMTK|nr:PaaI family thioesterase [Comamonas testosteroni]EED69942.1 thioesterase superfamily protein [Comamonas testosteroni KF-1]WQG67880.1 PaaI family thioesterase [Comamonas testosteroni]